MKPSTMHTMVKQHLLTGIIFLTCLCSASAQILVWQVSAEDANVKNPADINPKNLASGKNIFVRLCVACHGEKADGKGLIQSSSLISDTFQRQSDGAIFYKINTGKAKMPSFKSTLKADEIWSVINYLRVLVDPSSVPPAKDAVIALETDGEHKRITAQVYSADSLKLSLPEIDIHFYIQRDFGLMPIGASSNYTGVDGSVTVSFPQKVIGDSEGNVNIIARIENNFLYNDYETGISRKWGVSLLTEDDRFNKRAPWGGRNKSPIWLLLLANGIILAVWGVIVYIVFNLARIKKAGKIFIN